MVKDNPQDPFRFERETAIAVLNKRNIAAVKALKRFLLNMSGGPKAIETVLAQAVCCCAEVAPETFTWIVAQAEQLEPELYLERWAQRWVVTSLEQQGWRREQEFAFVQGQNIAQGQDKEQQQRLLLDAPALQWLRENSPKGEWLLLNRLFEIEVKGSAID